MGSCLSANALSTPEEKTDELTEAEINETKSLFTYENMVDYLIVKKRSSLLLDVKEKFGANLERSFIAFSDIHLARNAEAGWKAHIAIDDSDKSNLANAWNIIKDILIDEKLFGKVVKPDANFYQDKYQCGKQITVYCFMRPDANWETIFNKIESALLRGDIKESQFSINERQIPGGKYLSYCNDVNKDGNYIPMELRTSYNTANHPDPFINLQIEPERGPRP